MSRSVTPAVGQVWRHLRGREQDLTIAEVTATKVVAVTPKKKGPVVIKLGVFQRDFRRLS